MTRISNADRPKRARRTSLCAPGIWRLQDAKARFSELVRRVHSEGPQRVTIHGREAVVVVSAEAYRRLDGDHTGALLAAAMCASPHRDIEIAPRRHPMPIRPVDL